MIVPFKAAMPVRWQRKLVMPARFSLRPVLLVFPVAGDASA
jgi:hypothetical protein